MVADASGHGIQAALTTMQIDLIHKESLTHKNPDKRLEKINRTFVKELKSKNFFTAFLADIYPDRLVFASGGHPEQYLIRPGETLFPLYSRGKLIGMFDSEYARGSVELRRDDILIIFTDGLYEIFNSEKELLGEEPIRDFLNSFSEYDLRKISMEELNRRLLLEIRKFAGDEHLYDDLTLIAVRIK